MRNRAHVLLIYAFFLCSGFSGLIYQVIWVREFSNVFGSTVQSASLVVAVFMLGLGVGAYVAGAWADRRYAAQPESLLAAYGYAELAIAVLAMGVSIVLPHLGHLSAVVSSYSREANGWYVVSRYSYFARAGIAIVLLAPITFVMGGTLTLLVRHLVRRDLAVGGSRIAMLYGVNTAGAALGCLATDFALVPSIGFQRSQMAAVGFNLAASAGALLLARVRDGRPLDPAAEAPARGRGPASARPKLPAPPAPALAAVSAALALTGFAGMGMEIVWFRHFTLLLGGFRSIFSLLLAVILIGIGAGSMLGGWVHRRTANPGSWLIWIQGLFVASVLFGLSRTSAVELADLAGAVEEASRGQAALARALAEVWFNARPMLLEAGLPAVFMGLAFPLANVVVQRAEPGVGRRAGVLYLANTAGAVAGATVAGFVLLPQLGLQRSATVLMSAAWLAAVMVEAASRMGAPLRSSRGIVALAGTTAAAGIAIGLWLALPADYVIARALARPGDTGQLLTLSEGLTEVVGVREDRDHARELMTNGHPMASTKPYDQRYMRALAHIPLLSIEKPEAALVIGFGVGNTVHAATLHPSIRRVEVADLSAHVLVHAGYFDAANHNVLSDPRVAVYVNDGRQHLLMQPDGRYDLITLEPPPIAYAGVGALYSREFYALARSRLKPNGYVSQWLPAPQVPADTALAMIRAFLDVFPNAVILSGSRSYFQLIGANAPRAEIDPAAVDAALSNAPALRADLEQVDLGSVRELVGTFIGSARTLAEATRETPVVTDDRPLQEYAVRSPLVLEKRDVPTSVIDLGRVADWCPRCFVDGKPAPLADGLDAYLGLLGRAYMVPALGMNVDASDARVRSMIGSSTYLTTVVNDSAKARNNLGATLASQGQLDAAITQFEEALKLQPELAGARQNLAAALEMRAQQGRPR